MSKSNVIDFASRTQKPAANDAVEEGFLELIHEDIDANPASIKPIPRSLFDRMEQLIKRAESGQHEELLQG